MLFQGKHEEQRNFVRGAILGLIFIIARTLASEIERNVS